MTDVGHRFYKIFTVTFWSSMIILIGGMLNIIQHREIRVLAKGVAALAYWVTILTLAIGIAMRYMHSGKVCSGDFLEENSSTDGYLIEQGKMFKVLFYIFVVFMSVGCCLGIFSFFMMTS